MTRLRGCWRGSNEELITILVPRFGSPEIPFFLVNTFARGGPQEVVFLLFHHTNEPNCDLPHPRPSPACGRGVTK